MGLSYSNYIKSKTKKKYYKIKITKNFLIRNANKEKVEGNI